MRKTLLLGGIFLQAIFPFANALTLQDNFQALTIPVPKDCSTAYSQTLPSCTEDDFQKTSECSSECVAGLSKVAESVNAACSHVVVGSSTLLGRIFQGQIVPSLCPNNGKPTSSSSSKQVATPKSTAPATTKQAASTTSTAANKASNTASSSTASSAAQSSSTDSTSSTASDASTTGNPQPSATPSGSTSTSSAAPTASAAPAAGGRFGLTVQQQQIQAVSKSGGGSPFDIVGYTASASRLSEYGIGMILTGTVLLLAGFWL